MVGLRELDIIHLQTSGSLQTISRFAGMKLRGFLLRPDETIGNTIMDKAKKQGM